MGQKVHPYGFRLGYNKDWHSHWYAKRQFGEYLLEDLKLKRELKQKFTGAGAYQSTADVVRATAIVDADAPEAANVVVNADGKSGTIEAAGSDPVSGSWSCSAVLTIG